MRANAAIVQFLIPAIKYMGFQHKLVCYDQSYLKRKNYESWVFKVYSLPSLEDCILPCLLSFEVVPKLQNWVCYGWKGIKLGEKWWF